MGSAEPGADPYRERAPAPLPDDRALRRRRRTYLGLVILLWALFARLPLRLLGSGLSHVPVWYPWGAASSNFALGAVIATATWMFTSSQPGDSTPLRALNWGLRGLTLFCVLLDPALFFVPADVWEVIAHPLVTYPTYSLQPIFGMCIVHVRLKQAALGEAANRSLVSVFAFFVSAVLSITAALGVQDFGLSPMNVVPSFIGLVGSLIALRYTYRLLKTKKVVWHGYWLERHRLPSLDWVSLARLGDGRYQVLRPDNSSRYFYDRSSAQNWLEAHDYIPTDRAMREGIVASLPAELAGSGKAPHG